MKHLSALFLMVLVPGVVVLAQTLPVPDPDEPKSPPNLRIDPATGGTHASTIAALQSSVDRLTQTNRDLLDLLKKQQGVLEDIQFDRRLQSRQIQSMAERLEDSLQDNAKLQARIAALEATAAATPTNPPASGKSQGEAPGTPPTAQLSDPPPPPPSTYLPPPDLEGAPGTKSWHRLFTLSDTESRTTDLFHIEGPTWRVLWHNLDKPGKAYVNTSALFINAFPKDDTIPQKVCSKLGSGGDATELTGSGNYYLKVEASGGTWELAVEDFK